MLSRSATKLVAVLALALAAASVSACGNDLNPLPPASPPPRSRSGCASPPAPTPRRPHVDAGGQVHRGHRHQGQRDSPVRRLRDQAAAGRGAEEAARHRHQRHRPARHPGQAGPGARGRPRATSPAATSSTPAAWDAAQGADGKYYAVPFSAQSFALFIRKDWREKLGIAQPTTWDELDDLANAFTTKDPDGNGKADTYGYVIPGSTKRGYTSLVLLQLPVGRRRRLPHRARPGKLSPARSARLLGRRRAVAQGPVLRRQERHARRGHLGDRRRHTALRDRQGRHLLHRPVQHGALRQEPRQGQVRGRSRCRPVPAASRPRWPRARTST